MSGVTATLPAPHLELDDPVAKTSRDELHAEAPSATDLAERFDQLIDRDALRVHEPDLHRRGGDELSEARGLVVRGEGDEGVAKPVRRIDTDASPQRRNLVADDSAWGSGALNLLLRDAELDRLASPADHARRVAVLGDEGRERRGKFVDLVPRVGVAPDEAVHRGHHASRLRQRDRGVEVDEHGQLVELRDRSDGGHDAIVAVVDAARALAWWTHSNLASPTLYAARRDSFARLRDVLRAPIVTDVDVETAFVIRAARRLAACSDSNRWGLPYYERKEAFAQLRGALAVLDREQPR